IEVGFAKKSANRSATWVAGAGPLSVAFCLAANLHGAEFEHAKNTPVKSYALLGEEYRAPAAQFDRERDQQTEGEHTEHNQCGEGDVKNALFKQIGPSFGQCRPKIEHVNSTEVNQPVTNSDALA